MSILGHLLLALAAVVVIGRLFGRVLARFGQPPVAPYLSVVAQLGVIIYMFLVGLELNPAVIRGQIRATVATALGTPLGTTALTCAAIADVVAWCLLAFVVGVVQARVESLFVVAGLTVGFVAVMFFVVRTARLTGMDSRHAAGLGVLMNTRGLMELVVLNIGLDLGVISPTLATTPILRRLGPLGQESAVA